MVAAVLLASTSTWAEIAGTARIIDGDTIEVAGERIRLVGVDAPERAQTCDVNGRVYACGEMARAWLVAKTDRRSVRCTEAGRDRYHRVLAVCYAGSENLNSGLVGAGWALAFRRYSDAYVAFEDDARIARRGLWAGHFVPPWKYRTDVLQAAR